MNGRDLATWLVGHLGLSTLARWILVRRGRFALNFHGVSSRRYPQIPRDVQPHHSASEFYQAMAWLSRHFAFLKVEEFLVSSKPGLLLTFDDGHANNLTNILPVLAEFQAQGLFFVSTRHVRAPRDWLAFTRLAARRVWKSGSDVPEDFARDAYDGLSEEQLAELAGSPWAVIGSHTVSHPSLPACTAEQILVELTESRSYLQRVSRQVVDCFAYPYGDYNRQVAEAVRQTGYRAAFAVDALTVGLPAYELPRIGIYSADPSYLSLKLSGLHRRPLRGPALAWSPVQ